MLLATILSLTLALLTTTAHSAPVPDAQNTTMYTASSSADDGITTVTTYSIKDPTGPGSAPTNPDQLTCSADTSDAEVVPFATDVRWVEQMRGCMMALHSVEWVENETCEPKAEDGTKIGEPTFGFYSKGTRWDDVKNCFKKCHACLGSGINKHLAVTTSCKYDAGGGSNCEMGFNYGM